MNQKTIKRILNLKRENNKIINLIGRMRNMYLKCYSHITKNITKIDIQMNVLNERK